MKWCRLCSAAPWSVTAARARMDLRPGTDSSPETYHSPRVRWSRRFSEASIRRQNSVTKSSATSPQVCARSSLSTPSMAPSFCWTSRSTIQYRTVGFLYFVRSFCSANDVDLRQ